MHTYMHTHLPGLTASSICLVVVDRIVVVLNNAVLDGHHVVHVNRRVVDVAVSLVK